MCTPKAKQQIIDALRSGKYRQVKGRTREDIDGFCVMGLVEHLGIHPFTPDETFAVVFMNHATEMTFDEIADKIEAGDLEVSTRTPSQERLAALLRVKQDRKRLAVDEGDDEPPPPPLPAMIYIYPRRPVLSDAIGRRLPGGKAPLAA